MSLGRNSYPAAILVGAALGYAVSRYTGGLPIVGIAVGAFAGAAVNAAMEYSRVLLNNNGQELAPAYQDLKYSVDGDFERFMDENVPIYREKSALIAEAGIKDGRSRVTDIRGAMDKLDKIQKDLGDLALPNQCYAKAWPIYGETSDLLPPLAGKEVTGSAVTAKAEAENSISEKGAVMMAEIRHEIENTNHLIKSGMI
ncbi:hypothetical protein [Pseudooceanicola sp. 200-1SW]|uniref:hypothetical protein n=1 Tax=Pseudooceanicola sp. 200-1SW TaxID=3425949 RepID=UPI003D7F338C